MRRRLAAIGAIAASTTALMALAAVVLGATVAESPSIAAPAPVAASSAGSPAYPLAADHCYVAGMIPHHAQALELSELVLESGSAERVSALAEYIVADQSREIDEMRGWQAAWAKAMPADGAGAAASAHSAHGVPATGEIARGCGDHGVHAAMKGMATPEQLATLATLEGAAADRAFLELMTVHHLGALEMAETAVKEGGNAYVRASAKHVLVEQQREVDAMAALLESIP